MQATSWKRVGTLLLAGALAIAGCSGTDGDPGATGPGGPIGETGPRGQDGEPGAHTGTIAGTLKVQGGAPIPGASVTTAPLGLVGVTGVDGAFSIANVPVGIYSLTVSGTGVTGTTFASVVVVAATTTDIGVKTLAYTPITITFAAIPAPAGFGKGVALDATVTGATGALTYAWTVVSGPTAGAFSDAAIEDPTFTTASLQDVITGGKVKFLAVPDRPGVLNISSQQQTYATYTLKLAVDDGKYAQSKTVTVSPAGWVTGSKNVGVGTMVIGNDAPADTYAWELVGPPTSNATLEAADSRNPWFIADVKGTYTLTNGATSVVVTAGTFAGTDADCGICHNPTAAAKVAAIFAEYNASAHANHAGLGKGVFAAGIDGDLPSYSTNCVKCHTTGNDPTATNGGFDEQGFAFPTTRQAGNFAALTDAQRALGVIGCESCHGPVKEHTNASNAPKAFFNSEVCAYCHDALTHHDRYQLWSQSPHTSIAEAQAENRSTCTRCHSAQGFAKWTASGDLAATFTITLTNDEVEPQTCQACHDPHTTKLRIDGSKVTNLPAGFAVAGGGAGQLCMSCHNTRNGARGDDAPAPSRTNTFQAPHVAAQADVFMGKSAYFVSGINVSRHASVSETCVGCHMSKPGAPLDLFLQPYDSNHSFRVGPQVCGECHGHEVNGEATKVAVETALEQIGHLAGDYVEAKLNAAPFCATFIDLASGASSSSVVCVDTAANPLTEVHVEEGHGQIAALLTFTNAIDMPFATGTIVGKTFEVQFRYVYRAALVDGALTDTTDWVFEPDATKPNYDAKNALAVKAIWNYFLIHGDGSGGIHNPSYVYAALSGAEKALKQALAP